MENMSKKEFRGRIAAAIALGLATLCGILCLYSAFAVRGMPVPGRITNHPSRAGVTCRYSLPERTMTITSFGDDYVWPLAPFLLSEDVESQNILLAAEHFDFSPAIAFAMSKPIRANRIDTVRIVTDYREEYHFLRDSKGRITACRIKDTGSGIPDFTLRFRYDGHGRFAAASGNYIPTRSDDEKKYLFACKYGEDGHIQSIANINQNYKHEMSFRSDSHGRFTQLSDLTGRGTEEQIAEVTNSRYNNDGRLAEAKSVGDFGSTTYLYRRNGQVRKIIYEDHEITVRSTKLY